MAADIVNESFFDGLEEKLARLRLGEPLHVLDLFSGCGGMSLGLKRAQYTILGGVEINQQAINTYARNLFKDADEQTLELHKMPRDIAAYTPKMFLHEVLRKEHPENLVDVIVGGPPCQAFSRIGRAKLRAVKQKPEAYLDDERSNLYLHYLAYVDFFRPLAVLMENVPDIMNYGGKNVAEEIAISLEEMGYNCHYTILNTAHYGIPQLRQRFYLIAILNELHIEPCFPKPTHDIQIPSGYESARNVALNAIEQDLFHTVRYIDPPHIVDTLPPSISTHEALADLPPITEHLEGRMPRGIRKFNTLALYAYDIEPSAYALRMREWPGYKSHEGVWDHVIRSLPRDYPIFKCMMYNDQYPQAHQIAWELFEEKLRKYGEQLGTEIDKGSEIYQSLLKETVPPYKVDRFPNKWWKLNPDQPSRTLTAHMGKDTYSHIHYDSEQARVISVREAARLQSFPDGFQFDGAMNSAFAQIGNAVAPLQSYALGKHIRELLLTAVSQKQVYEIASI
jgi:DNA (cytosine-5)-methyltransferase 1